MHAAKVLLELVNDLILGVAITLWVRDEFLAHLLADWAFLDAIPLSLPFAAPDVVIVATATEPYRP